MSSAISMTDCSSVASMRTSTAGLPLTSVITSSSTNPSRIVATSPSVTIVPSSWVMSGMSSKSRPTLLLATVCRTTLPASVRISPMVRLREARLTVVEISVSERL